MSKEKIAVKFRAIKGDPTYDGNGNIKSEYFDITTIYQGSAWRNYEQVIHLMGFGKLEFKSAKYKDDGKEVEGEKLIEIKAAFDKLCLNPVVEDLTPDQKRIKELEDKLSKFEQLLSAGSDEPKKASKATTEEMKALRAEYKELAGKGGSPRWSEDELREQIERVKAEKEEISE